LTLDEDHSSLFRFPVTRLALEAKAGLEPAYRGFAGPLARTQAGGGRRKRVKQAQCPGQAHSLPSRVPALVRFCSRNRVRNSCDYGRDRRSFSRIYVLSSAGHYRSSHQVVFMDPCRPGLQWERTRTHSSTAGVDALRIGEPSAVPRPSLRVGRPVSRPPLTSPPQARVMAINIRTVAGGIVMSPT
jgi:hypothetical protein